jgi:hypothetical protein
LPNGERRMSEDFPGFAANCNEKGSAKSGRIVS